MPLTNANDVLLSLESDPASDILALMLTDALMEERGMLRSEADRHVERVRADAWMVKYLDFAARLIRAKGPAHAQLVLAVYDLLKLPNTEHVVLVLTAGFDPPKEVARLVDDTGPIRYSERTVSVPAGWVQQWHNRYGWPIKPPRYRRPTSAPGSSARARPSPDPAA